MGAPRVGPEGWGAQHFTLFFPLPLPFSLFFSLWGSSRGVLVVFLKRRDPQMCTFGVLGLSCEAPGRRRPSSTTRRRTRKAAPTYKRGKEGSTTCKEIGKATPPRRDQAAPPIRRWRKSSATKRRRRKATPPKKEETGVCWREKSPEFRESETDRSQ